MTEQQQQQAAERMRREVKGLCIECGKPLKLYLLTYYAVAVRNGVTAASDWLLCGRCYRPPSL